MFLGGGGGGGGGLGYCLFLWVLEYKPNVCFFI